MSKYRYKVPGFRILIQLFEKEEEVGLSDFMKNSGFTVEREVGMEKREKVGSEIGRVLAIGPMCWKHTDYGYGAPGWQPWCQVGDTILFGKYAGKLYDIPGTEDEVFLINDGDVQLVLTEGKDGTRDES